MKATILADGTLKIEPESELEAYALGQWSVENLPPFRPWEEPQLNVRVDLSGYTTARLFMKLGPGTP
ncbi:hypothetical protein KTE68_22090 [Burkholderia multivorans]|uniref:hypothetical protein n=1 Tax=Burkholderia multivorans TaxID=87883 RepID=UPI001C214B6B|nr:hypothetical protein [Burkholderia multivorans]MBU9502845.1 hypothetical protein [Burkholderia multivorans]